MVNLMKDDLDVTKAILLNNTTAILYIGWHSASEGLTEEEPQACVNHFSPYIKWRGRDFQTLTLTKGWEMVRAHKAWSQKTL